jgi:hypothetical protein
VGIRRMRFIWHGELVEPPNASSFDPSTPLRTGRLRMLYRKAL